MLFLPGLVYNLLKNSDYFLHYIHIRQIQHPPHKNVSAQKNATLYRMAFSIIIKYCCYSFTVSILVTGGITSTKTEKIETFERFPALSTAFASMRCSPSVLN